MGSLEREASGLSQHNSQLARQLADAQREAQQHKAAFDKVRKGLAGRGMAGGGFAIQSQPLLVTLGVCRWGCSHWAGRARNELSLHSPSHTPPPPWPHSAPTAPRRPRTPACPPHRTSHMLVHPPASPPHPPSTPTYHAHTHTRTRTPLPLQAVALREEMQRQNRWALEQAQAEAATARQEAAAARDRIAELEVRPSPPLSINSQSVMNQL